MENKIIFVGLKRIESKKKGKFFLCNYIINREPAQAFLDEEDFNKLEKKKLEFLKEYTATFQLTMTPRGMQGVLKDIK